MRMLIFLMAMAFAEFGHAQAPGYMGRRFTFFIEGNPTPAIFVQNLNNTVTFNPGGDGATTDKVNRFAFNFRPQITAEYLVSRDVSIGFSYARLGVGTTRAYFLPSQDPETDEFSINPDIMRGHSAGLHLKFYRFKRSASIAPIGFYHTFSLYETMTNTYETKKSKTKQFKNDFLYPVASIGVGRQSMIAKHLLLKTGVEWGCAFVPLRFISGIEEDWTTQQYASYNVHRSLFGHYLFNFNVAIGYVAF